MKIKKKIQISNKNKCISVLCHNTSHLLVKCRDVSSCCKYRADLSECTALHPDCRFVKDLIKLTTFTVSS